VIERQARPEIARQCDMFFRRAGIIVEPFTVEQAHIARQAFHDFGKGRHRAGLNFGDCFAYALSKVTGEPLLFKGDDFKKTDIVSALDSLSRLGLSAGHPQVRAAIERLAKLQRRDGTFDLRLMRGKDKDLPYWICLSICRSLKRWEGARRQLHPHSD